MFEHMSVDRVIACSATNGSLCNITLAYAGFNQLTRLEYYTDVTLGAVLAILTLIGLFANILVVVLFTKTKALRSRTSYLLRSLAVSDGIMALVGGTMFTASCFTHHWTFGKPGCVFYAMVMYWCGVTSIAHLSTISIERCITITHPGWSLANRKKIPAYVDMLIAACWIYGLVWAILPLVGVQSYTIEGRVSCSIDWFEQDTRSTVYKIIIFGSSFFLPVVIIITSNAIIFCAVKKSFNSQQNSRKKANNQKTQIKLAKTMLAATVFYLLAWTPYAIVCLWASFGSPTSIPTILFTWLGFAAKTSFIFNPFVYIFTNSQYRNELNKLLPRRFCLQQIADRPQNGEINRQRPQPLKFTSNNITSDQRSSSGGTCQMSLVSPQSSLLERSGRETLADRRMNYPSISEERTALVHNKNNNSNDDNQHLHPSACLNTI